MQTEWDGCDARRDAVASRLYAELSDAADAVERLRWWQFLFRTPTYRRAIANLSARFVAAVTRIPTLGEKGEVP